MTAPEEALRKLFIRCNSGASTASAWAEIGVARTIVADALTKAAADARALWSVRVLDAWADVTETAYVCEVTDGACEVSSMAGKFSALGSGPTPDVARLAAATAIWSELPEAVRREIGERP